MITGLLYHWPSLSLAFFGGFSPLELHRKQSSVALRPQTPEDLSERPIRVLSPASKTGMSLTEVESWIGAHIKPRRSGRPFGLIRDSTMSATKGILKLQRSSRWAIVRRGRIPVEITSGEVFRVEVNSEMKPTRMEFRHFVGSANVRMLHGQSGEAII